MSEEIELVGRDAFVIAAKDGETDGLALRKAFSAEMKAFDEQARTIDFVISTAAVDRTKDSISVAGWDFGAYMKSPVVLWCHDSSQPPVGKALSVSKGSNALVSRAEFMNRDLSPFADTVYRMYLGKFLSAVSVGFIPKTYSFSKENGREFGIDFKSQELLEYSCCPVPANPDALVAAKSAGIDTGPLREWASKILDEGGHILVPRNLLEETFRQAKTPRTTRQKYLAASEASDWKVGAARDLPIDDDVAWDGPAAAKRMLDDAGFDGESPDPEKAARGFLLHDAANPLLRSSYTLPFADIIDGELWAVTSGIIKAQSRIDQTAAPAEMRQEAREIANKYEHDLSDIKDRLKLTAAEKSGRRISTANEALLMKAMDHHESMGQCIKDVLGSNMTDDPDEDGDNDQNDPADQNDKPVTVITLDARATRLAEAKALRASAKL